MKKILGVVTALAVIALLLPMIFGTVAWDGGAYRKFSITVLDDYTNRPIEGATVIMLRDFEEEILDKIEGNEKEAFIENLSEHGYAITNAEGVAETGRMFGAGGGNFLWMRTGKFIVSGPLRVKKDGYNDFDELLQNVVGQKRFPLSKDTFSFNIYLKRKSEPGGIVNDGAVPHRDQP